MVECCRSQDREICKASWDLLYSVIKHNIHIFQFFKQEKIIDKFLNLVNSSNDYPVMENGLNFLSKLFELNKFTQEKIKELKLKPNEAKVFSKNFVNEMRNIFDHVIALKLFVRIYMIYRRVTTNFSGSTFLVRRETF